MNRSVRLASTILFTSVVTLLVSHPDEAAAQSFGVAFGAATAVADNHVAMGEPNSVRRPGIVYVYTVDTEGWEEAARLTASDATPGDRFGESIAAWGNTMIIGASRASGGTGAAYVYRLEDGAWRETARLSVPGAAALGVSVSLEGDLALVGTGDGALLSMGGVVEGIAGPANVDWDAPAVHAFRRQADGTWSHAGVLSPQNDEGGIGFGQALTLHGGVAYVGAERRGGRAGAVLMFEADGDTWTQIDEIAGTAAGSGFGAAIAVAGADELLIGAPFANQLGDVFVYRRDEATGEWSESARLRPTQGGAAAFGASLALADGELWIGAQRDPYATWFDAGSGSWSAAAKIEVERPVGTEFFATEVALSPQLGAIGFPEDDFGAGSGAVLVRSEHGWNVAARVLGESDAPPAVRGEEVKCQAGEAGDYKCESVDMLAFVPITELSSSRGAHVNDIWGWTDPETGREYALVGRGDGTAFVDVTDPSNPVFVANLPRTEGSQFAAWRDIKTYGNYALVVADASGAHGMQVFDLTRLRDVSDMPATLAPDVTYHGFGSSHNVIVNEESGFAYAVTGECGGGLHMVNVSDPLNPVGAGCYTHTGQTPLDSFTHDSQCVLYAGPDADYQGREVCFTSGIMGLLISDMTDRDNPATVGLGQHPGAALPHQGWLTEDHRFFLLGDEGDEMQGLTDFTRTLIWDVTELDDPVMLTEYLGPTRATDHNMYVRGDLVYQANYDAGLRIIDIADIEHPREVGYFDTVPHAPDEASFRLGAWSVYPYFDSGTIVVSSGKEGLFVLRYQPREPVS
ncbi:MAG: choice-of-anchor B family protein [Gemmatimonadota bacterium]